MNVDEAVTTLRGEAPLEAAARSERVLMLLSGVFVDGGIQRFNRTLLAACGQLPVVCDVYSLADRPGQARRWPLPRQFNVRVFAGDKVAYAAAVVRAIALGGHGTIIVGHVHLAAFVNIVIKMLPWRTPRILLVGHGIELWSGVRGLRRWALRGMHEILCVSSYTKQRVQQQAPELAEQRFRIFPNALDEAWVKHGEHLREETIARQLPQRFILSVARLDRPERPKGITAVIEALAALDDAQLHYVIAGRGNDMDFLRDTARRFGVEARVHFLGAVSDAELVALYGKCQAFVLPSAKEGFGIVYIEAMYFGAPVIAAREKGTLDVVKDGETGLLVTYNDVADIARAIERVLSNPALRDGLRERALRCVTAGGPFTFQAFTARCAEVLAIPYERVVASEAR